MYNQNAYELKQNKASSDVDCSPRLMLQAFQKNTQQKSEMTPQNPPVFYNGKNQTYLQGNQQLAVSSKLKPNQNTVHYSQMNLADIHALEQQQKYMQQANQNFTTVTAAVGGQIASNQHTRDKVMKNAINLNNQSKSANVPTNHQTLQCLSQIDQFKQKVNMVLQSQAFPANQNNQGVFQNQKYSIKQEGQGMVTGQKIGQNIPTGETTPSAMMHHKQNEIEMVQEQRNFIAWKNQLNSSKNQGYARAPQDQQPQMETVLSNQNLVSSKDQKRSNVYQHLQKSAATEHEAGTNNSLMATPSGSRSLPQQAQSMAHQQINQSIQNSQLYSNSYVQNNLKQQQRRKLLLEYSQENHNINQEIKSSQQQRTKKNVSHGGPESLNRENSATAAATTTEKSDQQNELIEHLKKLDIAALDDKDREKLRYLSLQYQFHLQQYEEQHRATYAIQPIPKGQQSKPQEQNQPSIMSLKSADPNSQKQTAQVSRMMRLNSQAEQPVSDYQQQGKSFQSDRFIDNEKNLSEDRLKRQSEKDRDPIPVVSQFQIKNNNSELNQKTPTQVKDKQESTLDQQDLQASQSDSNLKKSFNSNSIKRENSQFMSAKQPNETENKNEIKVLFNSEVSKLQYKNSEVQSAAVNSLQHFIENLTIGDKKKSNVLSLQNHQIQIQEPDGSQNKARANVRQNEISNLYNKYNKVYNQVDHHKNGAGYLRKSEGLNCPKPTPQQILNMNNSAQRLNLFKILQAKEHIKFQNIQNEKIQQLQQLQEQQELSNQDNPKQFMDFIQRKQGANKKGVFTVNQYQQKQLQNLKNIQQLKTLQKQQLNDQKAFGIFQMNELAQFKSMSDQNQKQILLNNLQQGKFEDFDQAIVMPQKADSVQRQEQQPQRLTQQSRAQNIHSREKPQHDYQQLSPNSNIEKTIEIKVNELNKNMYQPQIMQQAKLNQSVFDNQGTATNTNYSTEDQTKKSLAQSMKGSITGSIAEIQMSEPGSAQSKDVQQTLHVIRNPQLNQIQRRYEESKFQFEACLRETIQKQQMEFDEKSRFNKGGVNIDNILPGFSQRMVNGEPDKTEEKYRTRIKTRAGISMSNTNKNQNKLKINTGKDDDKNGNGPESSKANGGKKIGDDKDKKDEEKEEGEEPEKKEEVKRVPRYFPPRKMPNPFEEQANEQDRFMQARKEALAKYSNISKNRFKQDERDPLKYVIKPGNNSKLILRILEKSGRLEGKGNNPGWETADDNLDSLYNFKWKPTSAGLKYDLISKHGLKQVVNHVKGHYQITTKDNLFLNMKSYYESQKQNVFDYVPLTIVLDYLKDDVGEKMEMFMNLHKIIEKNINEDFEEINKKMLAHQSAKEKSVKTIYKINRCCQSGENLWLLKPTGFNRGIGIHIFQTFDQLREIMCESYGIGRGKRDKMSIFQTHNHNHINRNNNPDNEKEQLKSFTFVIQKLIEKPLLYHNRKFDVRVWAILSSFDGKFYIFKESYVRTSSKEYKQYDPEIPNEDQIYMQLTNNAVQISDQEYGKYEEGNITSTDTLFRHISETEFGQGKTKHELLEKFNQDKNKQMIDSIKSIKGKITPIKHTFELLGYDFILDEDLNTVMIEVNTNPCLEETNQLLKHLLPRMVDDMLNITIDPVFSNGSGEGNARNHERYKSCCNLPGDIFVVDQKEKPSGDDMHPGYKLDENLFEHVYTLEQ